MLNDESVDDEQIIATDKQPVQFEEIKIPPIPIHEQSTVSFNALAGYHNLNTLQVQGMIQGKLVRILIDGGSTRNLFSQGLLNIWV